MMDENEVIPEPSLTFPGAIEADAPGPGLLESSWRGAQTGFWWTSYVVGPIAALIGILGLGVMAIGVGSGRGLSLLPPFAMRAIDQCVIIAFGGAFIGAIFGFLKGLRGQGRSGKRSWWATANRPIRLVPGKRLAIRSGRLFPGKRLTIRPIGAPLWDSLQRRWRWLIGVPVASFLVAALAVGVYLGWWVDRRLADAIAAADRDDPFWRLDDLMAHREPLPDEENAALVVAEALQRLPENWPGSPRPLPGQPTPIPTEVREAYDRLREAAENVRLDDATADTLRDELETYAEAVQIARTIADYDQGQHALEIAPNIIDTLLPESQAARTAAQLLAADAAIRAHDGDLDGALDSCRAILGVARSIGDEPFSISQFVRVAIDGIAMNSVRRVLGQGEPSDAALTRLQADILDELAQPLLLRAWKGERASMDEMIRRLRTGELPADALGDGGPSDPAGPRVAVSPWGQLLFDNQRAVALEWMNEAVAIARRPAFEWPPLLEKWKANMERVRQTWHGRYSATIPLLATPALFVCSASQSRILCELGTTALLVAAERHRLQTGDWPPSIEAIDREILPNPPVDPYSGRSFLMQHRDGRLLIYSIGPNGVDEQGSYNVRKWVTGDSDDDVGSIGWDVPLRRQPPPAGKEEP